VLAWGSFLTVLINFLIVAWILFFVVKAINRLKFLEDLRIGAGKPDLPADVKLLAEIRDILAQNAKPGGASTGAVKQEPRRP
jgi:large conductance mechanosensitive channel